MNDELHHKSSILRANRMVLRTQCHNLGYGILNALTSLDKLPTTTESNETFAAIRDMLSELLSEIESRTKEAT